LIWQSGFLTAARIGSTAAGAAAGVEFGPAIQLESIHVKIDFYRFGTVQKVFIDDIFKTIHVEFLVLLIRLIQSHGQAWSASSAFVQKNPDGPDLFVLEIGLDLFSGRRGDFKHSILLDSIPLQCADGSAASRTKVRLTYTQPLSMSIKID
jgi:hypothetical protein